MRGLPHLHGVFWLSEEKLKTYKNENGDYKDDTLPILIDEFISVSTNTKDKNLNELVEEVNTHKHSKSCQKGNAKNDDTKPEASCIECNRYFGNIHARIKVNDQYDKLYLHL